MAFHQTMEFMRKQLVPKLRIFVPLFVMIFMMPVRSISIQSGIYNEDLMYKCASSPLNARSKSCIEWLSQKAVESFAKEPLCRQYLTVPLMMCIFKKEIGSFNDFHIHGDQSQIFCTQSGCGLSQMTQAGVESVKNSLRDLPLLANYEDYWASVGYPHEAKNTQLLNRRSAMSPHYSAIMTAFHLCADARSLQSNNISINDKHLAMLYNANPEIKYKYASDVVSCVQNNSWKFNDAVTTRIRMSSNKEKPLDPNEEVFYNDEIMGIVKIKRSQVPVKKEVKMKFYNDPISGIILIPQF